MQLFLSSCQPARDIRRRCMPGDWAHRAKGQGYAVLVVDRLTPRGVSINCEDPLPVPEGRLLKDA
jgi:hypothetical protein